MAALLGRRLDDAIHPQRRPDRRARGPRGGAPHPADWYLSARCPAPLRRGHGVRSSDPEARVQGHRPASGGAEGAGRAARAGVEPARRRVYFYDTPELALFARDLVLRARVTEGDDDDSTVKLRPLPLPGIPAPWSTTEGVRVELDVVGSRQVPSAKLDGEPDAGEIEQVAHGMTKLSKLFSKAQEASSRAAERDHAQRPRGARPGRGAQVGAPARGLPARALRRGVVPARRAPLHRALLQGGARRGGERGAGVPCAARSPRDRPRWAIPTRQTPRVLRFLAERLRWVCSVDEVGSRWPSSYIDACAPGTLIQNPWSIVDRLPGDGHGQIGTRVGSWAPLEASRRRASQTGDARLPPAICRFRTGQGRHLRAAASPQRRRGRAESARDDIVLEARQARAR